jgi:hypothetical protein
MFQVMTPMTDSLGAVSRGPQKNGLPDQSTQAQSPADGSHASCSLTPEPTSAEPRGKQPIPERAITATDGHAIRIRARAALADCRDEVEFEHWRSYATRIVERDVSGSTADEPPAPPL